MLDATVTRCLRREGHIKEMSTLMNVSSVSRVDKSASAVVTALLSCKSPQCNNVSFMRVDTGGKYICTHSLNSQANRSNVISRLFFGARLAVRRACNLQRTSLSRQTETPPPQRNRNWFGSVPRGKRTPHDCPEEDIMGENGPRSRQGKHASSRATECAASLNPAEELPVKPPTALCSEALADGT